VTLREARTSPGVFDEAHGRLLHAAQEGLVMIDETQRVVMMNPAAQRMFGCTAEQVLGSELARFIPQRYRAAHREHVRGFDDSGEIELSMGERLPVAGLRGSGEEFPLAITVGRAEGAGPFGSGRFFTAFLFDLSVERDLRARFDALWWRFQEVFELSPTAVWIIEGERIVFANKACVVLFGAASREALTGRSIYALLRPESHAAVRREVGHVFTPGITPALLHERIERLDGAVRYVEIALAPLPDHGRTRLQMVLSDVTQRRSEALESARSHDSLREIGRAHV
jgi:two-component system sensor histidine kinase UhpB